MVLLTQFQEFDAVSGAVPEQPFSHLPDIARRARSILNGRSAEQIDATAKRINSELESYFSDLKSQAVDELLVKFRNDPERYEGYFDWDGGSVGNGRWNFRREMDDELDIPTAQNSSKVDALKTIIENRDSCFFLPKGAPIPEPDHWPEGRTHELFAVLALLQLASCLWWTSQRKGSTSLSIAGECALEAMDAVCFAEHVREVEWLEQFHAKQLLEVSTCQDDRLRDVTEKVRRDSKAEHDAHEREKQSLRAEQLNAARHKGTNAAKELVCGEWAKATDAFPSAEKAGIHFADWLMAGGRVKTIQPRTVTKWIREHAKAIGIRFR